MGISQAEVRLRRLLAAAAQQENQAKLLHYVAYMREQLALLTGTGGEGFNQELGRISEDQALQYANGIDEIAEKFNFNSVPDLWESLRSGKDGDMDVLPTQEDDLDEPILAPRILSPALRRRRLLRDQEDGKKVDERKLDSATHETIDKHRRIQDALTDEMVQLSGQLKNNSYLMEKTLRDTAHYVDDTDAAIEYNLAATNRVNERASKIYNRNWKTSCYTWLILILMIFLFIFMVGLIRLTDDEHGLVRATCSGGREQQSMLVIPTKVRMIVRFTHLKHYR
ncbi:hypothetical protein R1sor_017988 [Riccia sorocarpa]|uniref:USE1-like protein n=1 Tax=Riccia sorocarpa TaxID=122646 RepID=A0ABD3I8V2_9MARC